MVQKTTATNAIDEFFAVPFPARRKDLTHVGKIFIIFLPSFFRIYGCKGGEIMLADYCFRGSPHRFFIEQVRIVPYIASEEWRANGPSIHAVTIRFRVSRLARVKFWRSSACLQHANGSRQNIVQRFDQIFRRDARSSRKSRDLGQRMDAGVGPPRALG